MKITSKQGNGNKIHIYIDGEYTLTLYDDYWYLCGIKDGPEISDDELASLKEVILTTKHFAKNMRGIFLK